MKLEGKALGIVQLVGKGEGVEAWRQLKLEYEGKSGNRQAAMLQGILNPWAAWEADTRDGRSVVESLNRWEKTIGLYRTARGVDISDGIFAATVLEHSPESYQNVLKQAPSNVRASHSAMRGWSREYAETLRRYDGTSGSSAHQTVSTGPVLTDVDQTRAVSRLAKTARGNQKERARARMARAKARARKVTRARIPNLSNSKDTACTARSGDTSVTTAGNASPKASRRVVRQQPLCFVLETIRTGAMRVIHITVNTEETQILRIKFVLVMSYLNSNSTSVNSLHCAVLPVLTNTSKSTFPTVHPVKDPGNKLC